MSLTEEQKKAIETEFNQWTDLQYAGKDKKARQKLGQFFTPPPLTIKMIEKFDSIMSKDILDPTVGAGGLLAACVICGADPYKVYGIELDPAIVKVARKRLLKLGVPPDHIKQGNALESTSYDFNCKEHKTFAVFEKADKAVNFTLVSSGKVLKEKTFGKGNAEKLKDVIAKLKAKDVKIFKI